MTGDFASLQMKTETVTTAELRRHRFASPQFCHNNKKAQKYLLGGFECVVKLHQVQLLPRVPIILKDLYDADLLEEDVIFAWAEKVGRGRSCNDTDDDFPFFKHLF